MKTSYAPIRTAIDEGRRVRCVVLRGFAGLLNEATQEHTKFSKEFSDRIRVIACLPELPNMIHSDSASESVASSIVSGSGITATGPRSARTPFQWYSQCKPWASRDLTRKSL